jgi:hypothetical protein
MDGCFRLATVGCCSAEREQQAIHEGIKPVFHLLQLCYVPPPTPWSSRGIPLARSQVDFSRRLTTRFVCRARFESPDFTIRITRPAVGPAKCVPKPSCSRILEKPGLLPSWDQCNASPVLCRLFSIGRGSFHGCFSRTAVGILTCRFSASVSACACVNNREYGFGSFVWHWNPPFWNDPSYRRAAPKRQA